MLKMGKFTKLFSNQPHEGKERIEGVPLVHSGAAIAGSIGKMMSQQNSRPFYQF